jgi:hypothetical protein
MALTLSLMARATNRGSLHFSPKRRQRPPPLRPQPQRSPQQLYALEPRPPTWTAANDPESLRAILVQQATHSLRANERSGHIDGRASVNIFVSLISNCRTTKNVHKSGHHKMFEKVEHRTRLVIAAAPPERRPSQGQPYPTDDVRQLQKTSRSDALASIAAARISVRRC